MPRAFASDTHSRSPALLPRAMAALDANQASIRNRDVMGIVDFAYPSRIPRFHLIDLIGGKATTMLVAHGRGSDPDNRGWVERFSNTPGSNASCSGSFLTGGTYVGRHGKSRKLYGLDSSNSEAASRAIVVHAAGYVSSEMAQSQGRIGRSQGCFAVSSSSIEQVLSRLGEGRLLFVSK